MEKTITRIALSNRGVRKFDEEVNECLEDGFSIRKIEFAKVGFIRILCAATLECDE